MYPHGCDVSNHLSLFLCVADYDKLLPGQCRSLLLPSCLTFMRALKIRMVHRADRASPSAQPTSRRLHTGWSHFAQFTIAVVNKDPKKSKYSGADPHQAVPVVAKDCARLASRSSELAKCALLMPHIDRLPLLCCRYTAPLLQEGARLGLEEIHGTVEGH